MEHGNAKRSFSPAFYLIFPSAIVSEPVNYDVGSQLAFRVQAVIGYRFNEAYDSAFLPPHYSIRSAAQSDYSKIQTFTVPESPSGSASPSQTATATPSATMGNNDNQFQFPDLSQSLGSVFTQLFFLLVVSVVFAGVIVVVVLVFRKSLKPSIDTHNFS